MMSHLLSYLWSTEVSKVQSLPWIITCCGWWVWSGRAADARTQSCKETFIECSLRMYSYFISVSATFVLFLKEPVVELEMAPTLLSITHSKTNLSKIKDELAEKDETNFHDVTSSKLFHANASSERVRVWFSAYAFLHKNLLDLPCLCF